MVQSDRLTGLFLVIMSVGMTAFLLDTYRAEAGYIRWAASVHLPTGKYWLAIAFCTACTVIVYTLTAQHFRRRSQASG